MNDLSFGFQVSSFEFSTDFEMLARELAVHNSKNSEPETRNPKLSGGRDE
jgi:hypothetical protein